MIYAFAKYVKGANITKLEGVVIEKGSKKYACHFASYVKGANINKLEDVIIKRNDPFWMAVFAQKVKGANIYGVIRNNRNSNNNAWNNINI